MQRGSIRNLEERLTTYGKSLLKPPTSRGDLLKLLDKIEKHLCRVEQSPTKSMRTALAPLMSALIADELLKHSDIDVRVGIASCISEITRITAPDAPYDDEKMKVVFQLIVSSFEGLPDVSDRSYQQRATILETVAKVRSCVIMLDLECDKMIIEMFAHFFKAIRPHHEEVIFASMETIMNLVIEESEEISADLVKLILSNARRDNEVNPTSKKLAERVIRNSSNKLKPYLAEAVKSLNSSLEDYNEAVALVCSENPFAVEYSNESIIKDQTEDAGSNHQNKNPTAERAPRSNACNFSNETGAEVAISNQPHDGISTHKSEGNLDPEGLGESDGKLECAKAEKTPDGHELPSDSVTVPTKEKSSEEGKLAATVKDSITIPASQASENEAADATSPTRGSTADEPNLAKNPTSDDTCFQKASEGDNLSEAKQNKSSQRKQVGEVSNKHEAFAIDGPHKSDDESASNSGATSADRKIGVSSAKAQTACVSTSSGIASEPVVQKRGRGRPRKIPTTEVHGKEKSAPPSLPKLKKEEVSHERTPRTSSTGKKIAEIDKDSKPNEYGEDLIGSKIKVWWPKDQMFYEGVVASFDSAKKRHKVLYTDGDMEVLNLHKQKWEYVKDEGVSNEDDEDSNHNTSDTRSKRKKTTSDTSGKPTSEAKGSPAPDTPSDPKPTKSKSGQRSSDARNSEDGSQKQGGKSEGGSANASSRSNDDSPKTPTHQKKDTIKTETRGRKRKAVGASGKITNSPTSKAKENATAKADSERSSDKAKGKNKDAATNTTTEGKSSKKRRR